MVLASSAATLCHRDCGPSQDDHSTVLDPTQSASQHRDFLKTKPPRNPSSDVRVFKIFWLNAQREGRFLTNGYIPYLEGDAHAADLAHFDGCHFFLQRFLFGLFCCLRTLPQKGKAIAYTGY